MTGDLHIHINAFDAIIISVFMLSALIAFFRGFIRELLSFGAWIGAALITIYLFPHSDNMMHHYVKRNDVAAGTGALITYFVALISISIVNSIILRYVKDADVGLLDNFLGMVFGAMRGAFIVSFGYLVMSAVIPRSPQPQWLKTSVTRDYLQQGADVIMSVAPKYIVDMKAMIKKQEDHEINPQNYPPVDTENDYTPGKTGHITDSIR